jgi:hypothetical protein
VIGKAQNAKLIVLLRTAMVGCRIIGQTSQIHFFLFRRVSFFVTKATTKDANVQTMGEVTRREKAMTELKLRILSLRSFRPLLKIMARTIAALAVASASASAHAASFTFQNILDAADPTFNQALGINDTGQIAGYFGSGAKGHPNKGYTVVPPYGQPNFTNQNFPGSVQTQVTELNNNGTTVGFWSNSNNANGINSNFGFVNQGGAFTNVNNPNTGITSPVITNYLE